MLALNSIYGGTVEVNMFAYCDNNPVMEIDPTGYKGVNKIVKHWWGKAIYISSNRCEDLVYYLANIGYNFAYISGGSYGVAGIAGLAAVESFCSFIGISLSPFAAIIAAVAGLGGTAFTIISARFFQLSNDVNHKNKNNTGVIFSINVWLGFWGLSVKSQ